MNIIIYYFIFAACLLQKTVCLKNDTAWTAVFFSSLARRPIESVSAVQESGAAEFKYTCKWLQKFVNHFIFLNSPFS